MIPAPIRLRNSAMTALSFASTVLEGSTRKAEISSSLAVAASMRREASSTAERTKTSWSGDSLIKTRTLSGPLQAYVVLAPVA